MYKKGILTVISGFSGAGKGTVVKSLIEKYHYSLSISATTRNPRPSEVHGKEYFFVSKEQFKDMIQENQLIEWAEYVGNYYGTPKKYVEEQLALGNDVILEIEMQGTLHVKKQFPDALLLFIIPPSIGVLKQRLIDRGTEEMDVIQKRLMQAKEEVLYISSYDYVVLNEVVDECVESVHSIIENEHCRVNRDNSFINQIKDELRSF